MAQSEKKDKSSKAQDSSPGLVQQKKIIKVPVMLRAWVFLSIVLALVAIAVSLQTWHATLGQNSTWVATPSQDQQQSKEIALLKADLHLLSMSLNKMQQSNRSHDHALAKRIDKLNQQQRLPGQTMAQSFHNLLDKTLQLQVLMLKTALHTNQSADMIASLETAISKTLGLAQNRFSDQENFIKMQHAIAQLPQPEPLKAINGLETLQQQLPTLQFKAAVQAPTPLKEAPKDSNAKWYQKSLSGLESLFVIQRDNSISKQLIFNADRLNALQIINLSIAKAKWAAYQGNGPLFEQAINTIKAQTQSTTAHNTKQDHWLKQLNTIGQYTVSYPQKIKAQIQLQLDQLLTPSPKTQALQSKASQEGAPA